MRPSQSECFQKGCDCVIVFGYIVVGGGSSGCVMANRLSATGRAVLLIEAGMDTAPGQVPNDILDANPTRAYFNPRYKWSGLNATFSHAQRLVSEYEQAKVLGGGSSINAQVANRGGPGDYDEWERLGVKGWNWESVLPYFCKLVSDQDFDGEFHGKEGPLPIQRVKRSDWSGFIRGVAAANEVQGLRDRPDFNGEFGDGFSPVPLTNKNGKRVSTAIGYLTDQGETNDSSREF
jgi:5-(hydroxymethyl)furfural/furfural oxidase